VEGYCELGNDPSGSIKCGAFLWLSKDYLSFPRKLFCMELVKECFSRK